VTGDLAGLLDITDPVSRVTASVAYIETTGFHLTAARKIRDDGIAVLLAAGGKPTAVARQCGVSLSHVKLIRRVLEASG
jgi:HJR/Mrr/RecB family endonuclease